MNKEEEMVIDKYQDITQDPNAKDLLKSILSSEKGVFKYISDLGGVGIYNDENILVGRIVHDSEDNLEFLIFIDENTIESRIVYIYTNEINI